MTIGEPQEGEEPQPSDNKTSFKEGEAQFGEDAVKYSEDRDLMLVDAVLYEHVLDVCVVLL